MNLKSTLVDDMFAGVQGSYRVVAVRNPSVQNEMNNTLLRMAVSSSSSYESKITNT
jgi:hypothetical protein